MCKAAALNALQLCICKRAANIDDHLGNLSAFIWQELRQALAPSVGARMAAAGVPGNVTLVATRTGTDLDPFIQVGAQALGDSCGCGL